MAPGPQNAQEVWRFVVQQAEVGKRLDVVLVARGLGPSRAVYQRWIEEGRIEVDGQVATRRTSLRSGSEVSIRPAPPPPSEALPQAMALAILYEDEDLIVLDKPPGLVVHPACGHPDGTLVNGLLHHASLQGSGDPQRPGIVHRLDKDTSGVMVVAKTPSAHEGLVAQFQVHSIERRYLAIASGKPPPQKTFDTFHARHPRDRKRFTSRVQTGRRALTHMSVIEPLLDAALVECRLETGRTHQIRVHLAEAGHAIVGDPLYGGAGQSARVREVASELGRQALHAAVLGFHHPRSGEFLRFEQSPPADFARALERLRPLPSI